MAYDHNMSQHIGSTTTVATSQGAALTSAADIATWTFGFYPVEIRGVAVTVTTTATVTAPVVDFYRRPTTGSDTNRVLIKSLTSTLANWAAGKVIYYPVEGTTISPGEDIMAEVSTTATAGNGVVSIMYQPKWEHPANNANMIQGA